MDELAWIKQEADKAQKSETKYEERAFYYALSSFTDELAKRIEQRQSELDGRIWNHEKW